MRIILIGILLLVTSLSTAQNDSDDGEWRLVAQIGRGTASHVDIQGQRILVETFTDDAWLYDRDTLALVTRLDYTFARLSNNGRYVYGYRYSEPFIYAMREDRPRRENVIFDSVSGEEVSLEPESAWLVRPSFDGLYLLGWNDIDGYVMWQEPDFSDPISLPSTLSAYPGDRLEWSPTRNQLAFYDQADGVLHIWTAGSNLLDVNLDVGEIETFNWSDDGSKIVVEKADPPMLNIYASQTGNTIAS